MPLTRKQAIRLARKHGAFFVRHGARHDLWQSPNGTLFAIPRHDKDLSTGVEKSIKQALGIR